MGKILRNGTVFADGAGGYSNYKDIILYVDNENGNDNNNGKSTSPIKTISYTTLCKYNNVDNVMFKLIGNYNGDIYIPRTAKQVTIKSNNETEAEASNIRGTIYAEAIPKLTLTNLKIETTNNYAIKSSCSNLIINTILINCEYESTGLYVECGDCKCDKLVISGTRYGIVAEASSNIYLNNLSKVRNALLYCFVAKNSGSIHLTQDSLDESEAGDGKIYKGADNLGIIWIDGVLDNPSAQIIMSNNVTVQNSSFVADTTLANYPYRSAITFLGATDQYSPDIRFDVAQIEQGIYAPVADCADDIVYIYASAVPEVSFVIPSIICTKC